MNVFVTSLPERVCPHAPAGASEYVDELTGIGLWFVIAMFLVAIIVSVGFLLAGKVGNSPHLTKVGVGGFVVVFLSAVALLVAPGIVDEMLGSGCIGR